jgi:hypothetical protein
LKETARLPLGETDGTPYKTEPLPEQKKTKNIIIIIISVNSCYKKIKEPY